MSQEEKKPPPPKRPSGVRYVKDGVNGDKSKQKDRKQKEQILMKNWRDIKYCQDEVFGDLNLVYADFCLLIKESKHGHHCQW